MKKLRAFLLVGALAVCGLFVFVACNDEPKNPEVNPVLDTNVYYLNPTTLNDVAIDVGEEGTKGKIRWVDATTEIQMGVHNYEWEFVPEDEDYRTITGVAKITGYQLIDVSDMELRESVMFEASEDFNPLTSLVFNQIDASKFFTQIVSTGEYNQVGEYTDLTVRLVPKGYYKILGDNNGFLNEIEKTFTLEITRGVAECSTIEEIMEVVNNKTATIGKIVLTSHIANIENNEILLTSYGKDLDLTIDLNGYSIAGGLKIGNHNVTNSTVYNNKCNINIMNSSETACQIGGSQNSVGIKVFGDDKTVVNLSNITFVGNVFGFASNGFCNGAKVNASHCCFISSIEADDNGLVDGAGAFLPAYYDCEFKHCCFQGGNGIYTKSGENVFDGCSIVGTSAKADVIYSGNGCNITGDAVVLDATYGYHKPLNVTLKNCIMSSTNAYLVQEAVSDMSETAVATYHGTVEIINCVKDADPDVAISVDDIKFETNNAITLNGEMLSNS